MIENLLNRLDGVKQTGPSKWVARCPAHDDMSPSLSIAESSDGKVLLNCFAGCAAEEIVGAIGMEMKDLFPESSVSKGDRKQYAAKKSRTQIIEALHHELVVLIQIIGTRMADNQLSRDSRFRAARPEWRPMPDEHWEREILAARRVKAGLEALYG